MQVIVRHPQHTDAVSAGVAVARVANELGVGHPAESEIIALWQELLADSPACRVGLACYGRRVVGYAAAVPTAKYGEANDVRPVRDIELRFFGALPEYSQTELLQRLIDFVLPTAAPAQTWIARADRCARNFLRTQGFIADAASCEINGSDVIRLVR